MFARDRELSHAIDMYNSALELGRYATPGTAQYAEAMQRVAAASNVARHARDDLRPLLPLVDHEGTRDDLNKTIETTRELESRCLEILG
jgi:hypothetical protein